tara:strand:- start:2092 stop:2253 length:162 start_codon:yes stop_codon:yes gene_type:complete
MLVKNTFIPLFCVVVFIIKDLFKKNRPINGGNLFMILALKYIIIVRNFCMVIE